MNRAAMNIAEPGPRLVARIVDTLVVGLPVVLVSSAVAPQPTVETVAPVAIATVMLLYESIQLALWGRTIGKRFAGIKVVAEESADGRLGYPRALVRAATYALPIAARPVPILSVLAAIFWIGNAALLLERPKQQALHDRIAGTRVVTSAHAAR